MKKLMLVFLCSVVLFCSGCKVTSVREKEKQTLIYGAVTDPASLNPLIGTDAASTELQSILFNGLLRWNDQLALKPDLAERWEIGADGCTYTFHLVAGAKWHDGQDFTAEDVAFTVAKILDPTTACDYAGDLQHISAVKVINAQTIKFILREKDAAFLSRLAGLYIVPKHLLADQKEIRSSAFNQKPIGTGPFVFQKRKQAEYLQFSAYEAYHLDPPKVKRFFYKIVPKSNVLAMQLQKGEVDVAQVDMQDYANLAKDESVKVYRMPGQAYTYIAWNNRLSLFADARVRKALTLGHDREAVRDHIFGGHGYLASADLPPNSWGYAPDLPPLPYDPGKAAALLAAAGWQKDEKGVLCKKGQPFVFTLLLSNSNPKLRDVAMALQADLRKLGIEVKLLALDFNVLREKHLFTYAYQGCIMSQRLNPDPDSRWFSWHSSQADGGMNVAGFKNERVDALFTAGRKTLSQTQRQSIYQEIERILYQEQPYLFYYYPELLVGMRKNIVGISRKGMGARDNLFWNIVHWEIK